MLHNEHVRGNDKDDHNHEHHMVVKEDEGGERGGCCLRRLLWKRRRGLGGSPTMNSYKNGGRGGLNRVSEAVKWMLPIVESLTLGQR